MKVSKKQREESIEELKKWIEPGDTVFTRLDHVSQSGMTRHISVLLILDKDTILYPNWHVSNVLGWTQAKRDGIKVTGCGMDMGFHLVYTLSHILFNDGYAINHSWI